MCSDNTTHADSPRREMEVDFEVAKQLLEQNNVVEVQLPKMPSQLHSTTVGCR